MNKANISYRIHYQCWHDEKCFEELYVMIRDIRPAEEYALFSDDNHSPRSKEEMLRRFEVMGKRMAKLRKLGVRVGINILNTLGHREENLAYTASISRKFTGYNGFVCPGIACPNDPDWYENYLKPVYQAAAVLHPDFIWIDDDFRMHGHHRSWKVGCFCPECLKEFHQATGFPGDLAELKTFFDCSDPQIARQRRKTMLKWNRDCLLAGAEKLEHYIHEIDENIIIGQMDGWNSWNGLDYQGHYKTLAGDNSQEVWWRPGGGIYRDSTPEDLVKKAGRLGRESAVIPQEVKVLQGELESFNYQPLHKCRCFTAIEPQLFCAAGNTGVAYNVFGDPAAEEFSNYIPLVKELKKINPFLDKMVSDNGRVTPVGIHDCLTEHERLSDRINPQHCWLEQETVEMEIENTDLTKIGLPQGFDFNASQVYVMRSNVAQGLEHDEIMQVLSRGVYLDGESLDTLNRLGYGEYTGFELDKCFESDTVERYSDHPLNGKFAGMLRNIRQTFWQKNVWSLKAAPRAQIVSSLEDFCCKTVAPCVSGCFVNPLGGRIFVAGYGAWENIYNTSKVCQLKNIFNYLSKDTLPGWIGSNCRMAIWVRQSAGGGSCEIFNVSMDAAENTVVYLRTNRDKFIVNHADGKVEEISAAVKNGVAELVIPAFAPWEVLHITW